MWEQATTREAKKQVIEARAAAVDYVVKSFYKRLNLGFKKRSNTDREVERMKEIERYARKVMDRKMQATYDGRNATWNRAYKSLVKSGEIPASVTMKQIYAAKERLHLDNEAIAPHGQVWRSTPLAMIQVDFTKSMYFHFNEQGQIFIMPNVATKKAEQRLWIGASIDVCTGVCYLEYFQSAGESKELAQEFIIRSMEEKSSVDRSTGEISGREKLLQGMPKDVYTDRGSGFKAKETRRMLQKMGLNHILGSNLRNAKGNLTTMSNKRARGKVERLIGHFKKDFETGLWDEHLDNILPPDLTLADLNDRLRTWCIEHNESAHTRYRNMTRWELFADTSCDYPPEDARSYATTKGIMRRVIQRLVQVKRDWWFQAPVWANDGEELEIVVRGKQAFCFNGSELEELVAQSVMRAEVDEIPEMDSDTFDGIDLKYRFNEDLKFYSDGLVVISKLPREYDDDKLEFFSKPRTVAEIKEKAQYLVMAIGARSQAKVIPYMETIGS